MQKSYSFFIYLRKVSNYSIIKKILLLNPDYKGVPVKIRLEDQSEFIGAHYAETTDDFYLVCSFQVETQELPDELKEKLETYGAKLPQNTAAVNSVLELIGTEHEACIRMSDPIVQSDSGEMRNLTPVYYKWKKEEVGSQIHDMSKNLPLLRLA